MKEKLVIVGCLIVIIYTMNEFNKIVIYDFKLTMIALLIITITLLISAFNKRSD